MSSTAPPMSDPEKISVFDVTAFPGEESEFKSFDTDRVYSVMGWIHGPVRKSKSVWFFDVYDGSLRARGRVRAFHPGVRPCIQCVVKGDALSELKLRRISLSHWTGVRVRGHLLKVDSEEGEEGDSHFDMVVTELNVFPRAERCPVSAQRGTSDTALRQHPHLRTTDGGVRETVYTRSHLKKCIYLGMPGLQVDTPIITGSDCEGAGEMFKLEDEKFFGRPVGLTVSGQLHLEGIVQGIGEGWCFGPTFRAEHSSTRKHLSEFWMLEYEKITEDMDDLIDVAVRLLRTLYTTVHSSEKVLRESVTYTRAVEILKLTGFEIEWGEDLSSDAEKRLLEYYKSPQDRSVTVVVVTHWPRDLKSFYMLPSKDCVPGRETVDCFDILVPGVGELFGGSMREHNYDRLKARCDGLGLTGLDWYLDLRKWHTLPHGGWGMGFERLVSWITGKSVHDVIAYPRTYGVHIFG